MPQSTPSKKLINLYNTKHNHTPQHPPMGLTVELEWDDQDRLTKADFHTKESAFEALVADAMSLTKAQELLVWHFRQQREDGRVIPMTYKEMERGTGMAYGTISSIVGTKNKDWWEKIDGSHQWTLTPDGLESAIVFSAFSPAESSEGGEND